MRLKFAILTLYVSFFSFKVYVCDNSITRPYKSYLSSFKYGYGVVMYRVLILDGLSFQ